MSASRARAARSFRAAHLRSLSTSTQAPSGSQSGRREGRPRTWRPEENLRSMHPRMIFVRPWDGLQSMAHAFAVIREIERRFGKIQEFVVLRDPDVWTNNLPFMHATFARAAYADAIPLEGRVIQVAVPLADTRREGGVGLDDLEVYLDSTARAKALEASSAPGEGEGKGQEGLETMMDVKLERSGMRESPLALDIQIGHKSRFVGSPVLRRPDRAKEFSDAMLSFGGFAPVSKDPADPTKPHTRMQTVMERWGWREAAVTTEASEEPTPSEMAPAEAVPWEPFTETGDSAATLPPSASEPSGSLPPTFPPPSLPPSPSPVTLPSDAASQANPHPVPTPKPKQTPPAPPKPSKKQRLLLAARSAGAQAASQTAQPVVNDFGGLQGPAEEDARATASGAHTGVEDAEPALEPDSKDAAKLDRDNNRAARKWWDFLTGGKE